MSLSPLSLSHAHSVVCAQMAADDDVKMAAVTDLVAEVIGSDDPLPKGRLLKKQKAFPFKSRTLLYEWSDSLAGRYQSCCVDSFAAVMEQLFIRVSRFNPRGQGLSGGLCVCRDGEHHCIPSQCSEWRALHDWFSPLSKLRSKVSGESDAKIKAGSCRVPLANTYAAIAPGLFDLKDEPTALPASASATQASALPQSEVSVPPLNPTPHSP
jgi:hypothetical protein